MSDFTILGLSHTYSIILLSLCCVISAITAIAIIKSYWEEVSFFMTRVRLGMPLFGRMKKLSKDIDSISEKRWFFSEEDLSATFLPYYEKSVDMDHAYYNNCHGYMRKSQDLGIKPMSFILWTLIIVMVAVEAMGFSYVLAGYTLPGASEGLQQKGALGIAFLISMVLVFLTHHTGTEMRANSAIKKARIWFNKSGDGKILKPNLKVSLSKDDLDDNDPDYIQLLSRIRDVNAEITPSWKITVMTTVFVIAVAVGSTYVRGKVLEQDILIESTGIGHTQDYPAYDNPYADRSELPSDLTNSSKDAELKAEEEGKDVQRAGGWATFIVLAVIFIFLQLLGVLIGYKTSFVGRESKEAYKVVGRFKNERDFITHFKRERDYIANTAQKYLAQLQKMMAQRSEKVNLDGSSRELISQNNSRTFLNYVELTHDEMLLSERKRAKKTLDQKQAIDSYESESRTNNSDLTTKASDSEITDEERRRKEIRAKLLAKMEAEKALEKAAQLTDEELEAEEMAKILAEQSPKLTDEEIEAEEIEKMKKEGLS